MKRDWKETPRGDIRTATAGFYVTLNRDGVIALGRRTHERMGAPEAVHLLYDAANNSIGIKPTSPSMRNAYPLGRRRGQRIVWALRLLREANVTIPETVEFQNAEIDTDGILVLDLRSARVSARAAALRRYRLRIGPTK